MSFGNRKLHFIAIGGAGMSGLALVTHSLGAAVSGSDRAPSEYLKRLRLAGLDARVGHDAGQVPRDADVVISTAVPEDNEELVVARSRDQRVIHRGELLAEVCTEKRLLAVAGTHGKTTTAGMIVHCLRALGRDPAFLLGGELPLADSGGERANAGWGSGEWIVAEADESDGSFLALAPEVAVVTNVELDHHSRWTSLAELTLAFARFAEPSAGLAVPPGLEALRPSEGTVLTFGLEVRRAEAPPDLVASGIEPVDGGGSRFLARRDDRGDVEVRLSVPGEHNALNALAALAAMELCGEDLAAAAAVLPRFAGMGRRFELKGSRAGARIYDDYAHHPTEVRATLEAARQLAPRRLIAIFQPHLYSRTKELAAQFGGALALADVVAVLDVYPAREEPVGPLAGISGRLIAQAAADAAPGRQVWWLPSAEEAGRALAPELRDGDLVLTLGAGDVDRLAESLVGSAP